MIRHYPRTSVKERWAFTAAKVILFLISHKIVF